MVVVFNSGVVWCILMVTKNGDVVTCGDGCHLGCSNGCSCNVEVLI